MRYVVAVSGGIDSVVLLDMLVKEGAHQLTVAHFDHGIRSDSAADARFVEGLAKKYDLPFVTRREELGAQASEALARERRYAFLKDTAADLLAQIATAHHADDVVETVAINLLRGTGWRGLAVLNAKGVTRPLLRKTKAEIRDYALDYRLEWVEDNTNSSDKYLRNRVRRQVAKNLTLDDKKAICELRDKQLIANYEMTRQTDILVGRGEQSRYFFITIPSDVAAELLRMVIVKEAKTTLQRPQLDRAVLTIKTARPGTTYEIGDGIALVFKVSTFVVKTP